MRKVVFALGWLASLAAAFIGGAVMFGGDSFGWNYAEDSYREVVYQRGVLAELVLSNSGNLTDQALLERILSQRNAAPFQKGFEYTGWQAATFFGLYKASSNGEILDFCFSDLDEDGDCKTIENLSSYVTLRAACEGEV